MIPFNSQPSRRGLSKALHGGVIAFLVVAAIGLIAPSAAQGGPSNTYTAEMALVLAQLRNVLHWLETNRTREQGAFAHSLAEGLVAAVSKMTPPQQLQIAHPHLMLAAENVERAADAAAHGDLKSFRVRARNVRDELRALQSILNHLSVRLPAAP
jgi:hypothetical protein